MQLHSTGTISVFTLISNSKLFNSIQSEFDMRDYIFTQRKLKISPTSGQIFATTNYAVGQWVIQLLFCSMLQIPRWEQLKSKLQWNFRENYGYFDIFRQSGNPSTKTGFFFISFWRCTQCDAAVVRIINTHCIPNSSESEPNENTGAHMIFFSILFFFVNNQKKVC